MQPSTRTTLFTHLFLPAMTPEHPLFPIGRLLHDLSGDKLAQALRKVFHEPGATPLQRAAAHLLLGEEQEAQTLLSSLLQQAQRDPHAPSRLTHLLLACVLCEQGKPQEALAHWRAGCREYHSQIYTLDGMRRSGFHPGKALLCLCLAQTLTHASKDAYASCLMSLFWQEGDPSLLLLRAINALALGDVQDTVNALRLAGKQQRLLPTRLVKVQGIPPTLWVTTLLAWMGWRQGTQILGLYDEVIEWLEETPPLGEDKARLQATLQEERALLRVLLSQQMHARQHTMQGRSRHI